MKLKDASNVFFISLFLLLSQFYSRVLIIPLQNHIDLCLNRSFMQCAVKMLQASSIWLFINFIVLIVTMHLLHAIWSSFRSRHTKFKFNFNHAHFHFQMALSNMAGCLLFRLNSLCFISFELSFQLRCRDTHPFWIVRRNTKVIS